MGHINDIFRRANLHSIREFLQYYTEHCDTANVSFEAQEEAACQRLISILKESIPDFDPDKSGSMFDDVTGVLSDYSELYMEIGILVGIQISAEIKHLIGTYK